MLLPYGFYSFISLIIYTICLWSLPDISVWFPFVSFCLVVYGVIQARLCLLILYDGGSQPFIIFIFHDEVLFSGGLFCL